MRLQAHSLTNYRRRGLQLLATAILALAPAFALAQSPARDGSSNAIVNNGAFTQNELVAKLKNGDGKHSAAELQSIFRSHNISLQDLQSSQTVNGRVTKSGKVIVGDRVVATNAVSMGRDFIPGSTKDGHVFVRPTRAAFQQDSLPALVNMQGGEFKFAVIKTCGNIVQATPRKQKAKRSSVPVIINNVSVPPTPPAQTVVIEKPVPQPPAPALPQTGTESAYASLLGLTAISLAVTAYQRSRRRLITAQTTKF